MCSDIANQLLESSVRVTNESKEIKLAAVDSTGLEAGHISRYFVRRKRSKQLETYEETYYRRWPKLAIACDCSNHMILSAITTRGPSVDINQFEKIMTPAINRYIIKHVLADAGYDNESNHRFAREGHNIKSTIPPKHGRPTTKSFRGKYRRFMQREFEKEIFGQRRLLETVFSMIKRNQGEALLSKSYWAQNREMMLKVLIHNIGIIIRVNELFYRACPLHFWFQYVLFSLFREIQICLLAEAEEISKKSKALILERSVYPVTKRDGLTIVSVFTP